MQFWYISKLLQLFLSDDIQLALRKNLHSFQLINKLIWLSQKGSWNNDRNAHLGENKITCDSACCMA